MVTNPRLQEYGPPRLTLGVVGLVAAIIPILLGYFLVSGMATNTSYTFPGGRDRDGDDHCRDVGRCRQHHRCLDPVGIRQPF